MDPSQNPSTHPNHDMARYSSPGRKPFALSPNKPMTLQMGMLIGQRDSAATEAEQLLNTVRRLREAKKNVITHMANLQKTVSTQSTQITELNSRLSDLRTHCDRLEIDNANLKRMTASPTLVASRKINGADQNIESATIIPRREKGSLMALQRAKDMEKEMQNVANKVDKSPIVSVPVSRKVSPLFSMRSQSDYIEQVTDIDTFSLMLDEALETPPESRVVSRMASQAFSFNLEKQKLVESYSILSGEFDESRFQMSSSTLLGDDELSQISIMADLEKELEKIAAADRHDHDATLTPSLKKRVPMLSEASKVKSLISSFTTGDTSPTKKPQQGAFSSYLSGGPTFGPGVQRERTASQLKMEKEMQEKMNALNQDAKASTEFFRLLDQLDSTLLTK